MKNKGKTVFTMAVLLFLAKCLGFVRDILLAYYFGANRVTDAYFLAQTIPELLFSMVVQAVAIGYIPIYTEAKKESKNSGDSFSNNLLSLCVLLSIFTIGLVNFVPGMLVKLLANGFEDSASDLTILFIRISVIALPFRITVAVFANYLNAEKSFIVPALNGIILDVVTVAFIFFARQYSVILLAVGIVAAPIVQLIILYFSVVRTEYRPRFSSKFYKDKRIREIVIMLLPVALGVGASQINVVVDRTIASAYIGGISALNYSNKVANTVENVIVMSLATVLFPEFSKYVVEKRFDRLTESIETAVNILITIIIPASALVMLFSPVITDILFLRGGFDSVAASLTSGAMRFYSIGLIGISINAVLIRALYALKQVKKTSIVACIGVGINVFLNLLLSKLMGLNGISLATSCANIAQTVMLFIYLRHYIKGFLWKEVAIDLVKSAFSTGVMLFAANSVYSGFLIVKIEKIPAFAISVFVALVVYLLMSIILHQMGMKQALVFLKPTLFKSLNRKHNYDGRR